MAQSRPTTVLMRLLVAVVLCALTSASGPSAAELTASEQAVSQTVWDGVFTAEQAARGGQSYQQECEACHLENLRGDGYAPALAGPDFSIRWTTLSLGDVFDVMATTMPPEDPGSLSRQVYIDIVAYLLERNRMPSGDIELQSDAAALQSIVIAPVPSDR